MAGGHKSPGTPGSVSSTSHLSSTAHSNTPPITVSGSDDDPPSYTSVRVKKRLRSVSNSAFALEPSPIVKPTRQRIAVACSNCRRRKIKCYGFDPNVRDSRCANCVRMDYDCLFAPVSSAAASIRPIPTAGQSASLHGFQPGNQHLDYDYQLSHHVSIYDQQRPVSPPSTGPHLSTPVYPTFPLVPPLRPTSESSRQTVQLPPIRTMIFPHAQNSPSSHTMSFQLLPPQRQCLEQYAHQLSSQLPALVPSSESNEKPISKRTKNLDVKDLVND